MNNFSEMIKNDSLDNTFSLPERARFGCAAFLDENAVLKFIRISVDLNQSAV